ncbi:MAG: hypothetical protein M3N29_10560 [Chloroflexota bacterium]|nr:hypothetical protein [Chloroflexota bacterium]
MEEVLVMVLRVAHIGAAVFWVGAAYTFFGFVEPTLKSLGPETTKNFMDHIVKRRRFPTMVIGASFVTVVAGLLLYWRASDGLDVNWITAPMGLGFTLGGLAGIAALLLGAVVIGPTIGRLEKLGAEVEGQGGPPTPEQAGQFQALDKRLRQAGIADFVLLTAALFFMAISRYLPPA